MGCSSSKHGTINPNQNNSDDRTVQKDKKDTKLDKNTTQSQKTQADGKLDKVNYEQVDQHARKVHAFFFLLFSLYDTVEKCCFETAVCRLLTIL